MASKCSIAALLLSVSAPVALGQAGDRANEVQGDLPADLVIPPAPVLSPEEELATFEVPKGFVVDLVAAEPLVVDPVQVIFDEEGKLWVVEMRGYMPDIDGNGELEPIGEIAVLSDTDGDGRMDEREVFAKDLVLPRGVAPMAGGALCLLPPDLVFLRDDDGDGTFDTREVVATGLRQGLANPEHAVNSPVIGVDNWIHFANWDRRVKRVVDADGTARWLQQHTAGGGQWGMSLDDEGRALRSTNPAPLYCDVVPSYYGRRNPHQRGFQGAPMKMWENTEVFSSRINPGVNRGYQPSTLRDDFRLQYFTGACGATAFRGDALGEDARGNAFVCEPTGNLIKRYRFVENEGDAGRKAVSVHDRLDFFTSTHERFRPVALATGADGALYVADMYRGLIQHRIFLTSFLRKQAEERGLAGPMGLGRIWRVRKADVTPQVPEMDLFNAPLTELVAALASPNSWLRDHAQRLLIEGFDGEANVVDALRALASAGSGIGSVHALWTLDAIDFADDATLIAAMASGHEATVVAAVQVAEPRLDLEGRDLFPYVSALALGESNHRVRLHGLLAVGSSDRDEATRVLVRRMTEDATSGLERSAVLSGLAYREAEFLRVLASRAEWADEAPGRKDLLRALAQCVGRERLADNVESTVELALMPPAGWWSDPVLAGLMDTRGKGPKGEVLPIPLRAMPVAMKAAEAAGPPTGAAAKVDEGCTWPGKPGAVEIEMPRELTAEESLQYARGAEVFTAACATCHQSHGGGQVGKAPTLRGTRFAVGNEHRLARILLHGLEGPLKIDGTEWNQEMPRFEGSDEDLAAVLTYVRRSWGNGADPVTTETVAQERIATKDRKRAFTESELE